MASSNRRSLCQSGAEVDQRADPRRGGRRSRGRWRRHLAGGDGLLEPPHLSQRDTEVVQRRALAVAVTKAPGSVQRWCA